LDEGFDGWVGGETLSRIWREVLTFVETKVLQFTSGNFVVICAHISTIKVFKFIKVPYVLHEQA